MQTIEQIKTDLKSTAQSLDLQGVAVDALCSLLAYSIYKNQILQAKLNLEGSFSTSTSLNSRIHHACNLLYSVFRGKCPYIEILNLISLETKKVKYLDKAFQYNGFYFYYKKDYEFTKNNSVSNLQYVCSSKQLQECEVSGEALNANFYFVDFTDENISEDFTIEGSIDDISTPIKVTSDVNQFYSKEIADDGVSVKYLYDFLVITIPGYGLRLIRRSDTSDWDSQKYVLKYIPYSETLPDLTNLKSIPGMSYALDNTGSVITKMKSHGFEQRVEDLNIIYSKASDAHHVKGTVATEFDLISMLSASAPHAYFRVYPDSDINNVPTPLKTTVVVNNITEDELKSLQTIVNSWSKTMDLTGTIGLIPTKVKSEQTVLYAKAVSSTKILTNELLASLTDSYRELIGEKIHHSKIEADIVRMGFDSCILYKDSTGKTEFTGSVSGAASEDELFKSYPFLKLISIDSV